MNLSGKAKIVGFLWLALGSAYLAIITRGFKNRPKELDFGESK
jgi:hypothetical protein